MKKPINKKLANIRTRIQGTVSRMRSPAFIDGEGSQACELDYQRDGFVAGGALLDRDRLDVLRTEFDRIFVNRDDPEMGVNYNTVKDRDGYEFFKFYNLRLISEAFHDLVTDPQLTAMLQKISGCDRIRILLDQIQFKPPGTGGANGWHRDMPSFPLIAPYTALTAWIPLDDVTEDNGAMVMVPGSHRWGNAEDICVNDWGLDLSQISNSYQGHDVRRMSRPLRAGHMHFHHDLTWHCSPQNRTQGKRRALAIHCFNADARYQHGGAITYPNLKQGDPMNSVAPMVLS